MEEQKRKFEEVIEAIDDLMIALYEVKKIFQVFVEAFSTENKPNRNSNTK